MNKWQYMAKIVDNTILFEILYLFTKNIAYRQDISVYGGFTVVLQNIII